MCMMLYLGTRLDVPVRVGADLRIEEVSSAGEAVRQWFSLPYVHLIGAHTHCGCGFPSVAADVPIEFYPGMFEDHPEREADLRSVEALIELIREQLSSDDEVQLYPVWNGEEGKVPQGTIELTADDLVPDEFFLNERFCYRLRRGSAL